MRLVFGLALGLALLTQPAVAGPKDEEKQQDKAVRQEAKAERKAAEPAPEPRPSQPIAAAQEPVAPQPQKPIRTQTKPARRQPQQPAATTSPSPTHTTVPAPHVPAAPVPTAASPVFFATPAPTAAPARPEPPARRERTTKRKPARHAVLGSTAAAPADTRLVALATALPPLTLVPRLSDPTRRAASPAAAPPARRARRPRPPARSPATAAVTRVVNVIPVPFRFALAGLILLVGLLALRARRLETERHDLSEDLGLLQSALLPSLPDKLGSAWVSAAYRPAEGLAAGGDFYDAFALDAERMCLLVGDVAGHGRDAVPLTADVRFTLRAYLEAGLAPRAALRAAAAVIGPRLEGRLVTVVVAVLDERTGRLTYAAAGHPPPVLAGVDERLVTVASSPPMGTGTPTGHRQTTVSLPPGATACFYTDGLSDARAGRRQIGAAGVATHLAALGRRADASDLLDRIVLHTDSQPDDMAACLLRTRLGAATAAGERVEELELDRPDDGRAMRFLLACGVPADEAEHAVAAAHDLLPVVFEVRCGPGGGTVAVHRPDTAPLPLPLA